MSLRPRHATETGELQGIYLFFSLEDTPRALRRRIRSARESPFTTGLGAAHFYNERIGKRRAPTALSSLRTEAPHSSMCMRSVERDRRSEGQIPGWEGTRAKPSRNPACLEPAGREEQVARPGSTSARNAAHRSSLLGGPIAEALEERIFKLLRRQPLQFFL